MGSQVIVEGDEGINGGAVGLAGVGSLAAVQQAGNGGFGIAGERILTDLDYRLMVGFKGRFEGVDLVEFGLVGGDSLVLGDLVFDEQDGFVHLVGCLALFLRGRMEFVDIPPDPVELGGDRS